MTTLSLPDQLDALLTSATDPAPAFEKRKRPAPAPTLSFSLARLRRDLAARLGRVDAMGEACLMASVRLDDLQAEYRKLDRVGRRDLKPELDAVQAEFDKAAARACGLDEAIAFGRKRIAEMEWGT